jgi:hypothetical protein
LEIQFIDIYSSAGFLRQQSERDQYQPEHYEPEQYKRQHLHFGMSCHFSMSCERRAAASSLSAAHAFIRFPCGHFYIALLRFAASVWGVLWNVRRSSVFYCSPVWLMWGAVGAAPSDGLEKCIE